MKERTIFILIAMMAVVLITSAFGAYQDSDSVKDIVKESDDKKHHKKSADAVSKITAERSNDASSVVGASGAGMSHKTTNSYLDTSVKANGPYVEDGSNTYKGKNRGRDLNESDSDSNSDSDSDSDSDHGKDSESGKIKNDDNFTHKLKYIKKKVSKLFKEIISKWGNQGSVMAPSGTEEMIPDPGFSGGGLATIEGLHVREKLTKKARNGMRKLKSAFRGRK
jgi:hypothetical protein